jgi:hypothetical protein
MAIRSADPASPPRAPVAFRVGVVGHRPNRLPTDTASLARITALLKDVLVTVDEAVRAFARDNAATYAQEDPRLFAISPLAEGSDRLFAGAALDLGYRLCVPMPFRQAEFETDFGDPGGAPALAFRALLDRAANGAGLSCFELDGDRVDEGAAYGAAGRVVLNQSDLLIAVWDGEDSRGKGGTVDTIREAIEYHVPVIWIDARAPFGWTLLHRMPEPGHATRGEGDEAALIETIRTLVREELAIPIDRSRPPVHGDHDQRDTHILADEYFAEHRPAYNLHFLWKTFRNCVGGTRPIVPQLRTRDYVDESRAYDDGPNDEQLIVHFAWADKLADLYADAHRSGVIATSIFSALAVALALAPLALDIERGDHPIGQIVFILLELVVVSALWLTIRLAKHRHYHEKWLEYRMLAEWIRQVRFLAPLGGGRPLLRTRAHLSVYGEPTRSWMYWHVRAITRARALPPTTADTAHVARCLDGIARTIDGQIRFHATTMERCERIQQRLHWLTSLIVRLTFAGVLAHFVVKLIEIGFRETGAPIAIPATADWIGPVVAGVLLICSAFLPAAGASLANINNQGEFARLGKRARAMRDSFLRLKPEADAMQQRLTDASVPVTMTQVTGLASRMATTMLEEVVDWRVVVLDLPQGLE